MLTSEILKEKALEEQKANFVTFFEKFKNYSRYRGFLIKGVINLNYLKRGVYENEF